jgi:hypothetical protein
MNTSAAANLRRRVAGVSLIAGPALLLTSSVVRFVFDRFFEWYQTMKLSFFFIALAVLGLVHLLRGRADGSGHVGGAMALAGCLSGASIVTAAYLLEPFRGTVPDERLQSLYLTVVNSPLPGLLFPVGLLILAVALTRKKVVPLWAGLLFALGAVLFPVGRVPGLVWAIFACDVLLTVSLGYVGWRVLGMTAEEWEGEPAARPQPAAVETQALAG